MELILKTIPPIDSPHSRGRNNTNTIHLFLPNIFEDCYCNIDQMWYGINFVHLTEFICRNIHTKPIDRDIPICHGKESCPIVDLLNKSGFHYNDSLIKEFWKNSHKPLNLNTRLDFNLI